MLIFSNIHLTGLKKLEEALEKLVAQETESRMVLKVGYVCVRERASERARGGGGERGRERERRKEGGREGGREVGREVGREGGREGVRATAKRLVLRHWGCTWT